jgi:hypothetical protein
MKFGVGFAGLGMVSLDMWMEGGQNGRQKEVTCLMYSSISGQVEGGRAFMHAFCVFHCLGGEETIDHGAYPT